MAEAWKPARVVKLDNENRALQRLRDEHTERIKEIDEKIAANNREIQTEYDHGAREDV